MNACARDASDLSQRRLDSLLTELRAMTDGERRVELDSAEAAWEGYRARHCGWEASRYDGGSMRPMVLSQCWAAVTERRIAELKGSLCDGGAPSCDESVKYDLPRQPRRRS